MHLELSLLMLFLGRAVVVAVVGALLLNGVIMVVSPATWFRLPPYIAFRGTLRQDRLATSWGRFEIRALGFGWAAVVIWGLVSFFFGSHRPEDYGGVETPGPERSLVYTALYLATCLGSGGCGILMLLKPKWWVEKYFSQAGTEWQAHRLVLERAVRILSLPVIAVAAYVAWRWVALMQR